MAAPTMTPAMQQQLLQDPRVQDAVKKAGEHALTDPTVQDAIKKVAVEKGPEMAAAAAGKMQEWANDPAVHAQAKHYAGVGMGYVGQAGSQFVGCIEQGPAGVRFLAFAASVASLVVSGLNVINPMHAFAIIAYIFSIYQAIFALTTMLFEAQPEWIAKVGPASKYQDMLLENAKFLSLTGGRGLFYVFQGTLWLAFCDEIGDFLEAGVGLALVVVGALHVAIHFGIAPQTIAAKARAQASQYQSLAPAP